MAEKARYGLQVQSGGRYSMRLDFGLLLYTGILMAADRFLWE
jgi:hypothetical protein